MDRDSRVNRDSRACRVSHCPGVNRHLGVIFVLLFAGLLSGSSPVGGTAGAAGGGIEIETRASADSVTVGERLRVVHRITYPDSIELVPPEAFETGTCRLMSVAWREERENGIVAKSAELELLTTDLERAQLPRMPFRFHTPAGDTLTVYSDEIEVPVRRLTGEKSESKPLKPQWEAPPGYTWVYYVGAALALAALAFWFVRRWRSREVVKPAEPELPPDFVALRRLDEIERMNLLEAGEIKTYYTLVVDTLRRYTEKRYGILAMDQTTDEILWALRRLRVDIADIEPVLREADLVKFAKYRPDVASSKRLIDTVRRIVARTAPRPLAVGDATGNPGATGPAGASGSQ